MSPAVISPGLDFQVLLLLPCEIGKDSQLLRTSVCSSVMGYSNAHFLRMVIDVKGIQWCLVHDVFGVLRKEKQAQSGGPTSSTSASSTEWNRR